MLDAAVDRFGRPAIRAGSIEQPEDACGALIHSAGDAVRTTPTLYPALG
ncbi:hypothetical protein MHK74_13735 [Microbacterium aurum]|nr:hypothetical protein [Microbacterium aurum]MCG7415604.1 hypothetical protein [Microbacterium aurum]